MRTDSSLSFGVEHEASIKSGFTRYEGGRIQGIPPLSIFTKNSEQTSFHFGFR